MPVNDGSNIRITPFTPMEMPNMAREMSSLLTAMRRASGGGGRGKGDYLFNPLTKKYEWVPGADSKTRAANLLAQNAAAVQDAWNNPKDKNAQAIQEKLKTFGASSVERQAQIIDDIRKNDIPKLAGGLGWDGQAFIAGPLADLVKQQKEGQKAIDETGALDTLWDSARIGWRNFTDSLADLDASADEQITRATERQKYVENVQAENAALRNRARRINEGADFFDRFGWDELAASTGEFLGENAATLGAAIAGGGIGGLVARGLGMGARAAQAANYTGQALAGIVPGAAQQLGASTNEILSNKDLSLDQKREALEDSYGPSTMFGAAMGAAVLPFGQMMNRGIANAWRRAGLGDSEVAKLVKAHRAGEPLPANASGSWSNALANARRADMEAENAIINGGIRGRLGQQFRDSVAEGAAFGGIGQLGTNAIVGNPLLDNVAGATLGGAIGGSLFTPFNRRDPYATVGTVLSPSAPVTPGRVETRVASTPGEYGFAPSGLSRTEGQFYQQAVNGQTDFDAFLSPFNIDRNTAATPEQVQAFYNISGIPSAGIVQRGNAGTPAPLRMEPTPQPVNRGPSLFDVMRQSVLNDPRAAQLWAQTPPNTAATGATPGTIGNAFNQMGLVRRVSPFASTRSTARRIPQHPAVRGTVNSGRRIQPMLAPQRTATTSNLASAQGAVASPMPAPVARPLPARQVERPRAVKTNADEFALRDNIPTKEVDFVAIAREEQRRAEELRKLQRREIAAIQNHLFDMDMASGHQQRQQISARQRRTPEEQEVVNLLLNAPRWRRPAATRQQTELQQPEIPEATRTTAAEILEETQPKASPEQVKAAKDVVSELKKEAWKYHGTKNLDADKMDVNNVALINQTVDSLDSGVLMALKDELADDKLVKGKNQFFKRHVAYTLNRVDERLAGPVVQEEPNATQTTKQPAAEQPAAEQPAAEQPTAEQQVRAAEVSEPEAAPTLEQPVNDGAKTTAGTDIPDDSGVQTIDEGTAAATAAPLPESTDTDNTAVAGGGDAGTQAQGTGKTPETPGTPEPKAAEQQAADGKRGAESAAPVDAETGESAGSPRVEASPRKSDGRDAADAGSDQQPRDESGDGDGDVNDPNVYPYDGNPKQSELLFEDKVAEDYLMIEPTQEYQTLETDNDFKVFEDRPPITRLPSTRADWIYDTNRTDNFGPARSYIEVNSKTGEILFDTSIYNTDTIEEALFPNGVKNAVTNPKMIVTIDNANTPEGGESVFEFIYAKRGKNNPWNVSRTNPKNRLENILVPSSAKNAVEGMWVDKKHQLHINLNDMVWSDKANATGDGAMITLRLVDTTGREAFSHSVPLLPDEWPIKPKLEALERTAKRLELAKSRVEAVIEEQITSQTTAPKPEEGGVQHPDDKVLVERLKNIAQRAAQAPKNTTAKDAATKTARAQTSGRSEVRHIEITPELRARYEAVFNKDVPRPKTEEQQQTDAVNEQLGSAAADTHETTLDKQELESGNWRGTVLEAVNELKKKQYELIAKEMQNTRGSKEPLPVNYQSPAKAIPYARALAEDFNTTGKLKKSGIPNPARYIKDRRVDTNALATDIVTALTHDEIKRAAAKMSGGKVSLTLSKDDSDLSAWATANGNFAVRLTNDQANRLHHYTVVDPATAGSKSPMDKVTDAIMMEAPQARGEVIANPGSCVRQ